MELTVKENKFNIVHFLFFVILFRFTPTNILGESIGMRLGDLICYTVIVIILFVILNKIKNITITAPLILLVLMSVSDQISLVISLYKGIVVLNDAFELTRMIIYIFTYLITFNYFSIKNYNLNHLDFKFIQLIMIILYAINFIEIYYENILINFLESVYSFEKSRGISAYSIRTVTIFANPNYYGIFLSIIFNIFYYIFLFTKSKKKNFIWILNLFIIVLCVFSTGSRTAFVVLLLGFIYNNVYSFIFCKKIRKKVLFIITPLLISVLYLISSVSYVQDSGTPSIFSRVLDVQNTSESLNERFEIWDRNNKDLKESIIFGNGPNKAEVRVFDNNYLFILYRNGLIGLVLFLSLILIEFFKAQINIFRKKNISESIVYSNIIFMISISLYSTSLFFNLQTGLLFMLAVGWYSALSKRRI